MPANVKIVAHGRGAGLEMHENDAILCVKRNAADDTLCQELSEVIIAATFGFSGKLFSCTVVLFHLLPISQEPMLAFPHRYIARIGHAPNQPRGLKRIKPAKRQDYLALANALLKIDPSEATRRAVEFLVAICTDVPPEQVPVIKWLQEEPVIPHIDLECPSALGRIAPHMRLRANIRP